MKKILITGATGFIGQRLIRELFLNGHSNIGILTRNPASAQKIIKYPISFHKWDLSKGQIDQDAFNGVETIIHLAGENIADGRWSDEKKKRIIDSRVLGSKLIAETVEKLGRLSLKIISASAVGYYGDSGEKKITEKSSLGTGFLAEVCELWEAPLKKVKVQSKVHFIRIGMVISKDGGAITKMELPFKAGIAGKLGDGKQFMSWIHLEDLVGQFRYLIENDTTEMFFNGVAPTPVTNTEFTKTMGRVLGRPTIIPAPKSILKLALGEMSTVLLNSQRVLPENFTKIGYKFKFKELAPALENIFFHDLKGEKKLFKIQYVTNDREEVFAFFKDEHNLEKITPPLLNFKVLGKSTEEIQEGTIIDYQLKLRGIPIKWKSLIRDFVKNKTFIDQQLKGPYKKWVHQHDFHSINGGTLMTDDIIYKVPFGLFGRIVAGRFVKRDVDKIFEYRQEVIGDVFDEQK